MTVDELTCAASRVEHAVRRSEWLDTLAPGDMVGSRLRGTPQIGTVLDVERDGLSSLAWVTVELLDGSTETRESGWYGPVDA